MAIMRKTLDAPEIYRWTDTNKGFVNIGIAATVLSLAKPKGSEEILKQAIQCHVTDCDLGRFIRALVEVAGSKNRAYLHSLLEKTRTRKQAAIGIGAISKGTNNQEDIDAIAAALKQEEEQESVGEMLSALACIGPRANMYLEKALDSADPWTRMNLDWQLKGYSAREVADMLIKAGAMDPVSQTDLEAATVNGLELRAILWSGGERLLVMDIKRDATPPEHYLLFKKLLDMTRPTIVVTNLGQTDNDNYLREPVMGHPVITMVTDLGTVCYVCFTHQDKKYHFEANPDGRWIDVSSVMIGFNSFMDTIGREERCFQLAVDSEICLFAVALGSEFLKVAKTLLIPLEDDPDRARREGIAYVQHVLDSDD